MARKLAMSPDISYMLGIYACNIGFQYVSLATPSNEMVKRFVQIAVSSLEVDPSAIEIVKDGDMNEVTINNSKLRKLFDKALESRDKIFKYKNEYSASYFAGMFDCNGAIDRKGLCIRSMKPHDLILLERIGFHTTTSKGSCYIRNAKELITFITPFSVMAKKINISEKARGLH